MRLTKLNELIEDRKTLKGRWEIGRNSEVQYRSFEKDEEIKVKGSLVAAEPEALVISVTDRQKDQKTVTSLWKLSGRWRANSKNQLVFEAAKENGKNDVLTFTGGWYLGEFQELLCTYEVHDLKTKRTELKLLVFRGVWNLTDKNYLTYSLGGRSDSSLRFRGAFQTRSILAKKGEIRYQVGVEVSGKRQVREVMLFGKWKYSNKTGLLFEMEYEEGQKKAIAFGGVYRFTRDNAMEVQLKSSRGRPMGVSVLLTRDVFGKDGQAFLRLEKSPEESRIEAGFRARW